jgi:hypothetical protein
MLSEILCLPIFRDLGALVRDSCVRGLHPIFEPPNSGFMPLLTAIVLTCLVLDPRTFGTI